MDAPQLESAQCLVMRNSWVGPFASLAIIGGAFDRSTGTEPFRLFIRLAPAFFGSGLNLDFSNISVHRGRESEKDIVLQ
jgi:hypothetical protein